MAEEIRTLTLEEIIEECRKESTADFPWVGEDEAGYLLFEIVSLQPDGTTKSETIRTMADMDEIGFAVYEGYGEPPQN